MHPDYSPIFAMLANEALDKDTSVNIRPPLLSILSIVFVMLVNWGSANADPTSSTVLITGSNRGIGLVGSTSRIITVSMRLPKNTQTHPSMCC
jgi:hypothetical protein